MLRNNQWLKEETEEKFLKNLERNENRNTTYQNTWDAAKAVLRGKFLVINTCLQ